MRPTSLLDAECPFDLVVMIASLGGLKSTAAVLAGLPGDFPIPLLVLQHAVRRDAPEVLAALLQRSTELPVRTASDGQRLGPPEVAVLPRGCSAAIDPHYGIRLTAADSGRGGDPLLTSAAKATAGRMIAVILTGMLDDGSLGVRAVKREGGRVLAEDPRTARASSMPAHAIATGCVDFALPNHRLSAALITLALAPGGADMFAVPTPAWATVNP